MRFLTPIIVVLLTAFLATTGCSNEENDIKNAKPECRDPLKKLKRNEDMTATVQHLAESNCTEASDALKALYDEGKYQGDILRAVQTLGDKDLAIYIIGKALFNKQLGETAARAALEMKHTEIIPELKKTFSDRRGPKSARKTTLEALLAMVDDKKELEDVMIKTLNGDPGSQKIAANRLAAKELGKIRSAKATPDLMRALFVSTKTTTGANHLLFGAARVGLAGIGSPAVPAIINALEGNDKDFIKFTRARQIPKWKWKWGHYFPVVLSDIRDPAAAKILAKNFIARDMVAYEGLSPEQRDSPKPEYEKMRKEWVKFVMGAQITSVWALGRFASDDTIDILAPVINNIDKGAEQRIFAQMALMLIGTPKAIDALITAFEKEETVRGKYSFISYLALGLGAKDLERGWKFVRKAKAGKESRKERGAANAIREKLDPEPPNKGASKDDKAQYREDVKAAAAIQAWIGMATAEQTKGPTAYLEAIETNGFESDLDYARLTKAAVMLARQDRNNTYFNALLRAYKRVNPRKDADVRSFILIALGRLGTKKEASRVRQAMESFVGSNDRPKKGQQGNYNEFLALAQYLESLDD